MSKPVLLYYNLTLLTYITERNGQLGCFKIHPNVSEVAPSLPVFEVLYIKYIEQKNFKIYFIKKIDTLHFPK